MEGKYRGWAHLGVFGVWLGLTFAKVAWHRMLKVHALWPTCSVFRNLTLWFKRPNCAVMLMRTFMTALVTVAHILTNWGVQQMGGLKELLCIFSVNYCLAGSWRHVCAYCQVERQFAGWGMVQLVKPTFPSYSIFIVFGWAQRSLWMYTHRIKTHI